MTNEIKILIVVLVFLAFFCLVLLGQLSVLLVEQEKLQKKFDLLLKKNSITEEELKNYAHECYLKKLQNPKGKK